MKKVFFGLAMFGAISVGLNSCEELEALCDIGEDDMATGLVFVDGYNHLAYLMQRLDEANRDSTIDANGTGMIDGAMVTKTADSLIIDYGIAGVVCRDNKIRKGSLRAEIVGDYMVGGTIDAALKNFSADGTDLAGDIHLGNNGNINGGNPEIAVTTTLFEIDEDADLMGNLYLRWNSGFNTSDDSDDAFDVAGNLSGNDFVNGNTYTVMMTEDLAYNKSCVYDIESGIMDLEMNAGEPEAALIGIDFIASDGCNNLFALSIDCEGDPISFTYPFN